MPIKNPILGARLRSPVEAQWNTAAWEPHGEVEESRNKQNFSKPRWASEFRRRALTDDERRAKPTRTRERELPADRRGLIKACYGNRGGGASLECFRPAKLFSHGTQTGAPSVARRVKTFHSDLENDYCLPAAGGESKRVPGLRTAGCEIKMTPL